MTENFLLPNNVLEVDRVKCFLCDHDFVAGEESWLLFEERFNENGRKESSLAEVISSALSLQFTEEDSHSTLLCDPCNSVVLEYEEHAARIIELRFRMLSVYNRTARLNGLVPIEISGVGVVESEDTIAEDANIIIKQESVHSGYEESAGELIIGMDEIPKNLSEVVDNSMLTTDQPELTNIIKEKLDTVSTEQQSINGLDDIALDECDIIVYEQSSSTENSQESYQLNDNLETVTERSVNCAEGEITFLQRNNKYLCLLCDNSTYKETKDFTMHLQHEHNTYYFPCDFCTQGFSDQTELDDHIALEHVTDCSSLIEYDASLDVDISDGLLTVESSKSERHSTHQFECQDCHKKYSSKKLLEEHINMHIGLRPYKCNICPKDFASKYTLQTHIKIHFDRERPFQCDECDKSFLSQQNLVHHKRAHAPIKSFICNVCSKAFATQHNLDVHGIVHSGKRPFICRHCGKSFARRAEVKDHERIHSGQRPFKCELCSAAFTQRSNLITHKKTTHLNEKLHKCEICGRSFKRRRLLDYHVQAIHTGERPHKCEICSASFVYPEHFKKHLRIHSGDKPFACEVCGKQFNSRDNRNAHRFVHSDKKPYECMECGAGFMRKPHLLSHMASTQHVNDTIIMNQPQIPGKHNGRNELRPPDLQLNKSSNDDYDDNDDEDDNDNVGGGADDDCNSVETNFKNIGTMGINDVITAEHTNPIVDEHEDLTSISSCSDQLGDAKYLPFEDLVERDNSTNQALSWVGIPGDKV